MKRRRHTPEQIIRKLREAERLQAEGADIATVARHLEISEQTFHRWRAQCGGMKASDAKRLKNLEKENQRLKRIVADQALDIYGTRGSRKGKLVSPARRRRAVWMLMDRLAISERLSVPGHRSITHDPTPGVPGAAPRAADHPGETARARPSPSALRLSTPDGALGHRGVLGQSQTHPAHLPR
jgi:DNA-binding transcriptional MerR regulator